MRSTKLFAAAALGALGLVTTGCFDIEQTLNLEKDLSGKAGFTMKVDMEPMVGFMTRMQREMAGKTGEPTKEELAETRKQLVASKKSETKTDFTKEKADLEKQLPPGVKLLDSSFKEGDLNIAANFLFGFDNVSKLSQIKFPKKAEEPSEGSPGPGTENPVESPFDGLKVVDEGSTILVTSPAQNPVAEQKEEASEMMSPDSKKQMEDLFKGLRVAFKITAPFEVVEHNAHRKEGKTLIWEYNIKTFESMTPEQLAQGVKVRYKK